MPRLVQFGARLHRSVEQTLSRFAHPLVPNRRQGYAIPLTRHARAWYSLTLNGNSIQTQDRPLIIRCPYCQTKFSATPESIPELGKEKRYVNCLNRFRLVRAPDEIVVQFRKMGAAGAKSKTTKPEGELGEERYPLSAEPRGAAQEPEPSAGVYASLFSEEPPRPQPEDTPRGDAREAAPEEDIPIEKRVRVEDVLGDLGASARSVPRILTTKDLMERKGGTARRTFQKQTASRLPFPLPSIRLSRLDTALIVVFSVVILGALLGLTDAGFFGMNLFTSNRAASLAAKAREERARRFSRDEVNHLIANLPATREVEQPDLFGRDVSILPGGDYAHAFVEEVSVGVRSVPEGALVYQGDKLLGETPVKVRVEKANRDVTLRVVLEGYVPQSLNFVADRDRDFEVALQKPSQAPPRPAPSTPPPVQPQGQGKDEDFIIY
jgi:hypothetical protein